MKLSKLIILSSVCALAACSSYPELEDAQYWQRKNSTSALYLQGPKAQQTLHQDIAACVNSINELQRVVPMRKAIPADAVNNRVPDSNSAEGRMAAWDTPKRDGYLRAEHSDYHDFETCMDYKGWERVAYLPYAAADRAREEYLENMGYKKADDGTWDREYVTSVHAPAQNPAPYEDLN